MELKVIGRLTTELIWLYKDILEYLPNSTALEIMLFCDFSEFEIHTNHLFQRIQFNEKIFDCPLLLKSISQEYMLPLEMIPIGWKSICKFEVLQAGKIELFSELPEISQWNESITFFLLS